MVIVTTEVTDTDVVDVEAEGSVGLLPHPVMVQVEVKVMELVLDGSADQLPQPVKDVDEVVELEPVAFGSAEVLAELGPVAKPLQVEVVQVPKVDHPVGVENVEDEVTVELVLHALPQAHDGEL
jgi:hypothetical protein